MSVHAYFHEVVAHDGFRVLDTVTYINVHLNDSFEVNFQSLLFMNLYGDRV